MCLPGVKTTVDLIYDYPLKPELRILMPEKRTENGRDAANFLVAKLNLY